MSRELQQSELGDAPPASRQVGPVDLSRRCKQTAVIEPPLAEVVKQFLRHCGPWRSSAARAFLAQMGGNRVDHDRRSNVEPNELTCVDMDTLLANF